MIFTLALLFFLADKTISLMRGTKDVFITLDKFNKKLYNHYNKFEQEV